MGNTEKLRFACGGHGCVSFWPCISLSVTCVPELLEENGWPDARVVKLDVGALGESKSDWEAEDAGAPYDTEIFELGMAAEGNSFSAVRAR